ncbi:YadA-like family protein [Paraburkholderia sp. SIMBA_049]
MNKTYRSVWNESTGTWVAVQENATGRKKKARSILAGSAGFVVATTGIVGVAVLGATPAQAGQVCSTSVDGKTKASFSAGTGSLVASGCGPNANNILASGHDLTIMEAQSSAMWVDGTSQTVNFRSGGANGKLVQLTTDARLTGLSAGINGSDAVTVSQLNSAIGSGSTKYFHANSTQTDSLASGSESIAVGVAAVSSGGASIAQGAMASASGDSSVALGTGARATGPKSVALGSGSVANSSTLGSAGFNAGSAALSAGTASGELSIGGVGSERRITNVAAGYSATDAVNVSQLMSANAKVNQMGANTAALLGGNAGFNSTTGAITNPTYLVANGTFNNVGAALTAIDKSKGGDNPLAVAYDDASKNQITLQGTGGATKIKNLAAGTAPADAVNISQLSGVTQALGGGASVKADGSIAQPTYNVYGNTYSNVGDALGNISSATSNIVQSLKYIKFGDFGTAAAAQASGTDTIALGGNANASQNGAIAIGRSAVASGVNSVALGYGSIATQANTFSVGNAVSQRRITNVADGVDAHDAATVGQVTTDIQTAIANLNTTTTSGLLKSAVRSSSLLGATPTSSLTPDQLIASGPLTSTSKIEASGTNSVAIGLNTFATADSSVAIGNNVQALSPGAVAIGQQAHTDGVNTVAIGSDASALADNAIAIGNHSTAVVAGATNGVAIGNNVTIGGVNSMGIGANIVASGSNSVTLGYGSADGGRSNVLSVGNTKSGGQRQIINVAAGTQKTDAVNVSQLTGVTAALGGGATVNTDGSIKAPTYNVQGTTATDVGTAISKLDGAVSNVSNNVTNLTQNFNNVVNGGGIKYFHANSGQADSKASGSDAVAIGGAAVASNSYAMAAGANATASGFGDVALGYLAQTSGTGGASAVGDKAAALAGGAFAGGLSATASGTNSVALGAQATASTANSVALGSNSVANSTTLTSAGFAPVGGTAISASTAAGGEVSVGKAGAERRITNVAAGYAATDAVNVSQLMSEDVKVNNVSNNLSNLSNTVNNINTATGNISNTVNNITNGGGIKYFHANSTLADSVAAGTNSVAIGPVATASMTGDVAIGNNATTTVGGNNSTGAVAIGSNATAYGSNGISIGANDAIGNGAVAGKSDASVSQALALGTGAAATNWSTDALGAYATASGNYASAIGSQATASGDQSTALGAFARATATNSTALGQGASATTTNSVALGYGSVANSTTLTSAGFTPAGGTAISAATAAGELSVGKAGAERRITNVAAGYAATDAVNVSQLQSEDAKVNNVSNNVSNIAGNVTNISNTVNNITNGGGIKYFHANSGQADSKASGSDAVAIGGAAVASNSYAMAAGANATASGFGDVALGYLAQTSGTGGASAVGDKAAALAGGAFAGGLSATASGTNSVALGAQATASTANSVALGSNSVANSTTLTSAGFAPVGGTAISASTAAGGEVSVGNAGAERRITNVAAGYLGTDAVNVSQLTAEDAKVNSVSNNVTYLNNLVQNFSNNIVNGAGIKYFHANSTLGDSSASGKDSVAIGGAATASTGNSVALGSNSVANSTTLGSAGFAPGGATLSGATAFGEVSVGAQGKERRITNVAAGYLSTDAVNVSQLMAEDVKVNNLSNTVNNIANGGANMKYFNVSSSLAAASANGADSVAAGPGAVVLSTASGSVALGANSVADRANTVSVGSAGSRRQIVNLAAGTASTDAVNVSQLSGVTQALGGGASVKADGSIAQPTYNVYGNTYSNVGDALGNISSATGNIVQSLKYIKFGDFGNAAAAQASLSDTIAFGGNANASQNGAIAIGRSAVASAVNSVALGYGSIANQAYTFSVGNSISQRRITNVADGVDDHDAVTVGQMTTDIQAAIANLNTTTTSGLLKSAVRSSSLLGAPPASSLTPDQLIASGPLTSASAIEASGTNSVAIGLNTFATADDSVAIGNNVQALSSGAVAIGQQAHTDGVNTVAIGSDASALADNAIAIGNHSTAVVAGATNGIAIGNNVTIGGVNSMGIGANIVAQGSNSVTLGYASTDSGRANVLSVGNTKSGGQRQIINVAAGTQNNDAVNVAQLSGIASALGGGASVNPTTGAVVAPAYTLAGNTYVNVAAALTSLDTRIASGGDPLAVDYDSSTKDVISLKGATGTKITGLTAGALNASSTEAINGSQLYAQGTSMAKALGGGASVNTATGEITAPAYTFGGGTYTNVADALTALNNAAGSGNALGVVYDDQDKTQITLAGSTGTKITKVAAGDVNASSTDAMNGTQLYNVAASTADAIGGGSSFDPSTGKITNPTFNIGGKTITNIAGAITNLDDRVYANTTDITNLQTQINEGGIGLVTQDATTRNILVASQTDGSIVDFAGTKGARRLTGVAAGNVNASSFDAVNGTQLYNVAASTASVIGGGSTVKTDGTISNPTYIVGGSTVTTIGGAITNLDARVYANSTDITNLQTQINEGGIGLVTQDATSKNILVASKTDGSIVDFTGKDGARVLTGVAAGTGDFDAVNNAQLKAAGIISADGSTKTAVTYNTVKDDSGKEVTDFSNITLGDGTSTSKPVAIHNVAAGEKDTDAVNYSQYADLVSKVNSISNAGTGVDTLFVGDGDRNTEQAKAGGTHATAMGALSVANGLQSVATGYASNATGSNAVAIGANSTASGNNSVALGANSVASEDNTVSVGSASQQRRVTNVAAGTATTDAVNVGQLNDAITNASNNTVNQAVQQSNSYTDSQFNKMNDKMNSLGAAAMAATSLIPNARAEGNFQMSAAAGTYGGAAAVAIGANYWVNDRVLVNAHVTRATGNGANTGASAGVTIGF